MAQRAPTADTHRRLPFREQPTAEAYALDRRLFAADGRPGAFLFFDCPDPIAFLNPDGQPYKEALLDGGIARLCIRGPLEQHDSWWASYAAIVREAECALAWPGTNALVLDFDTPGGVCSGMLAAHRALRRLRARHNKPIIAWVNELAASAGYGLASACDEIWGPPEFEVGSIGVILCVIDETKRLEKEGIGVRYVVTGDRKADLHPGAPVTDEVLRVAQDKVNALGTMFFDAAARARGTTAQAIQSLEAAVFRGKNAVSAGLADGVSDWPEFLDTLRGTLGANVGPTRAQPAAA